MATGRPVQLQPELPAAPTNGHNGTKVLVADDIDIDVR
jgi:hypothetical protein